jgi:hypothetical protein
MPKQCVNGNCSLRKDCGTYHQALNTFEASGANGKFERHSCRKGKCDHFANKEFVPYGEEWIRMMMRIPKPVIITMLASCGQECDKAKAQYASLKTVVDALQNLDKKEASNG